MEFGAWFYTNTAGQSVEFALNHSGSLQYSTPQAIPVGVWTYLYVVFNPTNTTNSVDILFNNTGVTQWVDDVYYGTPTRFSLSTGPSASLGIGNQIDHLTANQSGFENGLSTGWAASTGYVTISGASTDFANTGSYSLKITCSGSGPGYANGPTVPCTPGTRISLSGWVYVGPGGTNLTGLAGYVSFYDSSGTFVSRINVAWAFTLGKWSFFDNSVTVPANCFSVAHTMLQEYVPATVYLDDLHIYETAGGAISDSGLPTSATPALSASANLQLTAPSSSLISANGVHSDYGLPNSTTPAISAYGPLTNNIAATQVNSGPSYVPGALVAKANFYTPLVELLLAAEMASSLQSPARLIGADSVYTSASASAMNAPAVLTTLPTGAVSSETPVLQGIAKLLALVEQAVTSQTASPLQGLAVLSTLAVSANSSEVPVLSAPGTFPALPESSTASQNSPSLQGPADMPTQIEKATAAVGMADLSVTAQFSALPVRVYSSGSATPMEAPAQLFAEVERANSSEMATSLQSPAKLVGSDTVRTDQSGDLSAKAVLSYGSSHAASDNVANLSASAKLIGTASSYFLESGVVSAGGSMGGTAAAYTDQTGVFEGHRTTVYFPDGSADAFTTESGILSVAAHLNAAVCSAVTSGTGVFTGLWPYALYPADVTAQYRPGSLDAEDRPAELIAQDRPETMAAQGR
jgi:hypothetical protein